MIELVRVSKSVRLPTGENLQILRDVSLRVSAGESVAVTGRSGAGKTTLLNVIGLLDPPDAGTYSLDGQSLGLLTDREASRLRGRTFGFVFQSYNLLDRRSALANVAAPLALERGSEYRRRHQVAEELLAKVGLADRLSSYPEQLSNGEQQRVAIARSLVRRPRYLLADEPTGALDVHTAATVIALLLALVREAGCGLVIITHDPEIAGRADRTLELQAGHLDTAAHLA